MFNSSTGFGSAKQGRPSSAPTWMRFDGAGTRLDLSGVLPNRMDASDSTNGDGWTVMTWLSPDYTVNGGGTVSDTLNSIWQASSYNVRLGTRHTPADGPNTYRTNASSRIINRVFTTFTPSNGGATVATSETPFLVAMSWYGNQGYMEMGELGDTASTIYATTNFVISGVDTSNTYIGDAPAFPNDGVVPYEGHLRDFRVYDGLLDTADFVSILTAGPAGDVVGTSATLYLRYLDSELDISGNSRNAVNTGVNTIPQPW